MPVARYWRLIDFLPDTNASSLQLSEVVMYDVTTSVMAGVTVSASEPPDSGALALLTDGSSAVACVWSPYKTATLQLTFDFGAAVDVRSVAFGSGDIPASFPVHVMLQSSTDGVTWLPVNSFNRTVLTYNTAPKLRRLKWPGAFSMQAKTSAAAPEDRLNFFLNSSFPPESTNVLRLDWENGSLRYRKSSNFSAATHARESTNILRTGKIYMEVSGLQPCIGVIDTAYALDSTSGPGYNYIASTGKVDFSFAWEGTTFYKYNNRTFTPDAGSARPNTTATVGICFDLDNAEAWVIIDGVQKTKYPIGNFTPEKGCLLALTTASLSVLTDYKVNFGSEPFVNTPPVGFTVHDRYEIFSYEEQASFFDSAGFYGKNKSAWFSELPTTWLELEPNILTPRPHTKDTYKDGQGFIKSTVSIDNVPPTFVRRRVFIKEAFTGLHIDDQYSQAGTGVFEFKFLDLTKQYIVYSIDDVTGLATTISGPIYPTKMPIFMVGPYA